MQRWSSCATSESKFNPKVLTLYFSARFLFLSYHVRTDLGTGSKHEFTLPVGIVDLTRQQGGKLVRSGNGFIQEALAVTSAEIQ